MIPKIIHYVWVGPRRMPDEDSKRIEQWKKILPDWRFQWWNNENIDFSSTYLREAYAARAWNRISDYVRMDALCKQGGVYLDTDIDLIRPLDSLLNCGAFLGFQTDHSEEMVNGAVFGAIIGHWLPNSIRNYFNEKLDGRDDLGSFSGPTLLTKTLVENGLQHYSEQIVQLQDVTIYPKAYFYPYYWQEQYSESVIKPETYTVHRWAESWIFKPSFRGRLRRKTLHLFAKYAPQLAFKRSLSIARRGSRLAK